MGQEAYGILSDGRLKLSTIYTDCEVEPLSLRLPWTTGGEMTRQLKIYQGEETLQGTWRTGRGTTIVQVSITRKGEGTFSSQVINELTLSSGFLEMPQRDKQECLLDIGWYTRTHPFISEPLTIKQNEQELTNKEIFLNYARNRSDEEIK